MVVDISSAPFKTAIRELWLLGAHNGVLLPSSRFNGHALTATGAAKRTTADGVRFYNGNANSYINLGALHNLQAKLWMSFRFKLDYTHTAGSGNRYLLCKELTGNDFVYVLLSNGGDLQWQKYDGGVLSFNLTSAALSWVAGTWYHIIVSISSVNGARLRIDNGAALTSANLSAVCNGGNLVIGKRSVASTDSPNCTITDVVMGTDDLTTAEETDLYKGIPPADAVHVYTLDEGRGVTANDRGSGANNGTLGSAATWAFGRVEQPCLGFDGINDYAASASGLSIKEPVTLVLLVKAKSTYTTLAADHYLAHEIVDASNELRIYYAQASDAIVFHAEGGAVAQTVSWATRPTIDSYLILIMSVTSAFTLQAYVNGSLVGSVSGVGPISAAAAISYLGASSAPGSYDVSKPLFSGLFDGAFTARQALEYSRFLDKVLNLGLGI